MKIKPNPELIDEENPEWTDEMFKKARPASEVVPGVVAAAKRARGRPFSDNLKVSTTLRLDAAVIKHFKAAGAGWQTRINAALIELIKNPAQRRRKSVAAAKHKKNVSRKVKA